MDTVWFLHRRYHSPATFEEQIVQSRVSAKLIHIYTYTYTMHILIILTIFTYHHVDSQDSTDFCKGNSIPDIAKNVSHCFTYIGRCGDIMIETRDQTCSCDVLCITHTDCWGDFERFCPEDSITARSISQHYDWPKSTCLDVNYVPYVGRPAPTHAAMVTACSNDVTFNFMDAHSIVIHGSPVVDSLYGITFSNAK